MGGGGAWAVRQGRWKLLQAGPDKAPELYDLQADISEQRDLSAQEPEAAADLKQAWDEWNAGNLLPSFPSYRDYHQRKNAFYATLVPHP